MKKAIAIGVLGLALASNRAAAQTAVERDQILANFQQGLVDYTQRQGCFDVFPEATSAASPAPKVFTLPVAMVFRQLIAEAISAPSGAMIGGPVTTHHPEVMQPFPAGELNDFPRVLSDALPLLPLPLEYRLIGNDLVIRDLEGDVVVAVLRKALGAMPTKH